MKPLFILTMLSLVPMACEQSYSPLAPTSQQLVAGGQSPNGPAPTPPAPTSAGLTCTDALAEIYDGPDPDKAHARVTAPAGQWATTTLFELVAYPTPLVDPRDVDSTGRWPVQPGTTQEFRTDKPSVRPHQIDVRRNDQVIASRTGGGE
jgi:hypothetical protein